MLLDNYGDGKPKSPAVNYRTPERRDLAGCALTEREFLFPAGVLGFANYRHYRVEQFRPKDGSESPFFTLRAIDQSLEFPLIHPVSLSLDYRLHANDEVLAALEADSPDQLVPMLIVTVKGTLEEITVNLQGPLVFNPSASLGLQLVVEDYPLRHPLLGTGPS